MIIMPDYKMKYCLLAILLMIVSCTDDDQVYVPVETQLEERLIELYGSKKALVLPNSDAYNDIDNDPNNPITSAKVALGKLLFHETALGVMPHQESGRGTYSCASCHHAAAGFQSGLRQGIGEGGIGFGLGGEGRIPSPDYLNEDIDVQPIRSPTILNVSYQDVMLWNGQFGGVGTNSGTEANWTVGTPKETNLLGFEGIETQAIAALGVHRQGLTDELLNSTVYKELFDAAFPNIPEEERYTPVTIGMAIAAYERCVLTNQAPFQEWIKGNEEAMGEDELRGAELFFGKANCYACHSGPALNSMKFYALGMNDLAGDEIFLEVDEATKKGRGGFTNDALDNYKFKTPQLYNLADVSFFGHGGSFKSVREVVNYKNKAAPENSTVPLEYLSDKFVPLNLTEKEIDLIALFLEKSLYDPNLDRYVPSELPSGNCFPNADPQSKMDLGCE